MSLTEVQRRLAEIDSRLDLILPAVNGLHGLDESTRGELDAGMSHT